MSSKIASKKRLEKDCDWAFDITTRFQPSSDDESESESGPKLAATNTGTGGHLLIDDLDLSKRGENVAYNPNPFSIAKINAAYRRQTTAVQSPIQPLRPLDNPAATTTNAGAAGLLIDDLEPSKREDNGAAYNPNPFTIAKTNATYRRQTTVDPIQPVRPSEQKFASTDTRADGLLIDDLELSGRIDNGAYNPNPYSIAKTNAPYRPQTTTVEPIQPERTSYIRPATTNIGDAGLLIDDLDLSEWEDNGAYNPNPYSIAKINAAYPGTGTVNGSVVQATQSARLAKKPTQTQQLTKRSRTNQTTIMEGFRTQAMKKPRINNALRLPVPPLLPISSNSNPAVKKSPQSLSPSESLISSPSPNPSNHLAKMRIPDDSQSSFIQVKSPKRDAYQYSTKDLDEEWTTLPSKKKRRKPKFFLAFFSHIPFCVNILLRTENPTFTKPFHIPGLRRLLVPPTMKAETITTSAVPKVKVYLPPPLNFVDVKHPSSKKNSGYLSEEVTENRKHASPSSSPTNFYTDAYPSPGPSSSKLPPSFIPQAKRARNYTPPDSRPGVGVVTSYRPPSPPTSDLPIPSDGDIQVEVDHEGIQLRYAKTKRLSRKVLCSYFLIYFIYFCFLYIECDTVLIHIFWYSADAQVLMYGI